MRAVSMSLSKFCASTISLVFWMSSPCQAMDRPLWRKCSLCSQGAYPSGRRGREVSFLQPASGQQCQTCGVLRRWYDHISRAMTNMNCSNKERASERNAIPSLRSSITPNPIKIQRWRNELKKKHSENQCHFMGIHIMEDKILIFHGWFL